MLPTLLLGPVVIPTYPLLLLLALWGGLWLAARRAGQLGLEGDEVYNAGLVGLLTGLVGARLGYVLSHWQNYAGDLAQIWSLTRSALSFQGGLLAAALGLLIYLRRRRVPWGLFFDALAPGMALAVVIVHIGAFLGGERLGAVTTVPWAVEMLGAARHPIQLYEAAAGLVILAILYVSRAWRPWPGFQFWLWAGLFNLSVLLLEVFRARPDLFAGGFLTAQLIALAGLVVTLAVMAYNFHLTVSLTKD